MRPDVGSAGAKCRLLTNHYRLDNVPDIVIYQYAIDMLIEGLPIDKRIPPKVAREILKSVEVQSMLKDAKDTFVFDGTPHSSSH